MFLDVFFYYILLVDMYIYFRKDKRRLDDTIEVNSKHTILSIGEVPLTPRNVVYLMNLIFKLPCTRRETNKRYRSVRSSNCGVISRF